MAKSAEIYDKFLEEYGSEDAVRKYTAGTAGYGINYLLHNDYSRIYLDAIDSYLRTSPQRPLRMLEFGCGAGMNVIELVALLEQKGIPVEIAYGTDFSARLLQSATEQAKAFLGPELAKKVSFYVARNEALAEDLAAARGNPAADLAGFFDLIVGVNTFRYCHRLGKEQECAADIYRYVATRGSMHQHRYE